jgi:hypothetical protein
MTNPKLNAVLVAAVAAILGLFACIPLSLVAYAALGGVA